ncbi:CoA transferase [Poseidonocella sp. HB161398]|uniref:CoA transferase n=1 Tax=Poseidonocella sp. HB161398 TaxID=2320855 RepID=UPI001109F181|nr:CoA transferase [Poseidonocella sp. HB161398]
MTTGFDELMAIRGGAPLAEGELALTGGDPFYPTPLRIGEATALALAARGVAANDLWALRGHPRQQISVDCRHAAACSLYGTSLTQRRRPDGGYHGIPAAPEIAHMIEMTQCWPAAGGGWFLPHTNLPHLEARVLGVLGCDSTVESLSAAIAGRGAAELEDSVAAVHGCGGMVRSPEDWLAHPQGAYLAARPVVEVEKIAESAPEPLPPAAAPLGGLRVLDLTRIIAGPTAGLALAEHGAEVLAVTAAHLPQVPAFFRDTSHGKRSAFLDLGRAEEAARLKELVRGADVFLEGYRPGRLAARGFGTADLAALRPGIVHVSVNCFGSGGPFGGRAGWDQVAQAVTGLAHVHGQGSGAGHPQLMPVFVCDFLAGYLAAYGTMLALARRAREGGSYRVQVSLCQAAMFLLRRGRTEGFAGAAGAPSAAEAVAWMTEVPGTPWGDLRTLSPALGMAQTPCRWASPPPAPGQHAAAWRAEAMA